METNRNGTQINVYVCDCPAECYFMAELMNFLKSRMTVSGFLESLTACPVMVMEVKAPPSSVASVTTVRMPVICKGCFGLACVGCALGERRTERSKLTPSADFDFAMVTMLSMARRLHSSFGVLRSPPTGSFHFQPVSMLRKALSLK